MSDTYEFITILFEKSKVLNDLNSNFLKELEFGDLSTKQKIDLFYRSTLYHENLLQAISDIVKYVDKTSVLLPLETQQFLKNYESLDDFTKSKVTKVIEGLTTTQFVPEYLTTCPKCGGILVGSGDKGCKRIPLRIGDNKFGYTYRCITKEGDEVLHECTRVNKQVQKSD